MWADSPDCPGCATGWHTRCRWPELADDGDGELVERCCDGLLIARQLLKGQPWQIYLADRRQIRDLQTRLHRIRRSRKEAS